MKRKELKFILQKGLAWVEKNCKINYDDNKCNNKENSFTHRSPLLCYSQPNKNDESQYSSKYIKGQKGHNFVDSVLDNLTAMLKNKIVIATPAKQTSHGLVPAAPGTNTPTTREANISFAPSRKKLDIKLESSLVDIRSKYNIKNSFVKR